LIHKRRDLRVRMFSKDSPHCPAKDSHLPRNRRSAQSQRVQDSRTIFHEDPNHRDLSVQMDPWTKEKDVWDPEWESISDNGVKIHL
jgi:hypothetical protein